jgi:catechol 2,3-dioxygenase-like lactoylglutathione lyase family enzyme
MITKVSHTGFFVADQEEARRFYTEELGFEVRNDTTMDGGYRWLTIGLKTQPDLEVILMEPKVGPMLDEESANALRTLIKKGKLGVGVFQTDDCRATHEELKRRGVEFVAPPEERFYGIEAVGKDNSGNWFSMTQPKPLPVEMQRPSGKAQ